MPGSAPLDMSVTDVFRGLRDRRTDNGNEHTDGVTDKHRGVFLVRKIYKSTDTSTEMKIIQE